MDKQEFIDQYNELEEKRKELYRQANDLYRRQGELQIKFAEENRQYENGTILRLKCRVGKAIRYKIAMVSECWANKEGELKYAYKEVMPYAKKCLPPGSKPHYHISSCYGIKCDEIIDATVCNREDYPTCTCDTCCWLEAYHNTIGTDDPKLHCSILLDQKVYEAGHPACDRYSWWTWASGENSITHREQLLRDKGHMSSGERGAHAVFRQVLSDMAEKDNWPTENTSEKIE